MSPASPASPPGPAGLSLDLRVPGRLDLQGDATAGEVIAVIGPNGAGKTTLLHALAGLIAAEGRAVLDERDLLTLPTTERQVGLVFQDRRLFPHLSALDNVAFGLRARGVDRATARARSHDWLDRLGVAELAGRKPRQVSGGQAQRIAIARALVGEPSLLLLDEPFTGLDVGVAASLRIELTRHLADFAGITLLVTHDALDALTLADRVLVLDDGRLAQDGAPQQVAARPRTEHVARLVGLNVLRESGQHRAFSPHSVTVSLEEPHGSARNLWRGGVRGLTPHGDQLRLAVDCGGTELLADVTPTAAHELGLTPGREVWLSVKETAVSTY